jgi:hypothetical protein
MRQCAPLKRRSTSTRLRGSISHKAVIFKTDYTILFARSAVSGIKQSFFTWGMNRSVGGRSSQKQSRPIDTNNTRTDGQMDKPSPCGVHLMHFVQEIHTTQKWRKLKIRELTTVTAQSRFNSRARFPKMWHQNQIIRQSFWFWYTKMGMHLESLIIDAFP